MANLKEIRTRITSVEGTMQITSAMKMVSASKLKRAQNAIVQMRPFAEKFNEMGLELFSGSGGFYHWCKLRGELSSSELNERLFKNGAAILKGTDCDMERLGAKSPLNQFFRFSFGPLLPDTFDSDIEIMAKAIK